MTSSHSPLDLPQAARNTGQYLAAGGIPGIKGIAGTAEKKCVPGTQGVKGYKGSPGQVTIRSVPYRGREKGLVSAEGQVQGTGSALRLEAAVGDAGIISVNLATGAIAVPVPSAAVGDVVPSPSDVVPVAVAGVEMVWTA